MRILIVEDDLALADVVALTLRRAGFETLLARDGMEGLACWQAQAPDLVLLDLNLPKLDGLAVCRHVAHHGGTPVVILSVRSSDQDIVAGLEMGADDYIVKPFNPRQLVARIEAVLRRTTHQPFAPGPVTAGAYHFDTTNHKVWLGDRYVATCTPLEARLLEVLLRNTGQVIAAELLIDRVWGHPAGGDRAMLKQLVYRLRRKLDEDPAATSCIETVPSIGYAFVAGRPTKQSTQPVWHAR